MFINIKRVLNFGEKKFFIEKVKIFIAIVNLSLKKINISNKNINSWAINRS